MNTFFSPSQSERYERSIQFFLGSDFSESKTGVVNNFFTGFFAPDVLFFKSFIDFKIFYFMLPSFGSEVVLLTLFFSSDFSSFRSLRSGFYAFTDYAVFSRADLYDLSFMLDLV